MKVLNVMEDRELFLLQDARLRLAHLLKDDNLTPAQQDIINGVIKDLRFAR